MSFGISNSVKSQQVQICTPEMLREAIDSPLVAMVCADIKDAWEQEKRGEITPEEFEEKKGRLKKQLPILTPHATFRNGRRLNADAVPSGLSMYDLDHIPDPEGRWREIEPRKDELGIVMAHITPSTEGLRLIFIIPQGMNLAQAQRWMADQVGDQKYDECVKDYARCSFVVPREYVLFLSNSLFEERERAQTENGNRKSENYLSTPSASLVTPVSGGQSETTASTAPALPPIEGGMPEGQRGSLVQVLEDQLGGIPTHGSRNNFIFTMACHLRYVCNDDPEWIARILPTYGENRDKWMATIRSACNRNQTPHMSRLMQRVLAICKEREREEREAEENPDLPPQMPRILPPLIRLLVSRTPDIYKPAVAHAVFPALATHLWQTRFRYIDNVEHEATLMNVLMAGTGAGKNCISEPINRIMADIRQRDMDNLRREREWKKEVQSKGANKDKRQRPEGLVIQEIDPDMTNAAFVQRLADAEDRFLYTKMNEIDQFDALKGSGRGKAQFQIMCLAFDPRNVYGQTRIGTGSVSERVSIRFNWNASTTVQKGRRYFSQVLTDGPISRINFCTIPEREIGADMPVYGTYDEA
ncbi:MAG: VirE protein, partial [Bacteroidaceae bacterium]|nr:VirE protein [Bacteroidaceae bacterium]